MKHHIYNSMIALLVICFMVIPVSTVHASKQNDPVPASQAEEYLLNELRATGVADFDLFPEEEPVIGGEFLVSTLKDPEVRNQSFIYIGGVTVEDDVFGNDLFLPANIQFYRVEFKGFVDFNSSIMQAVWITDSQFKDFVDLSFATFNGNIVIADNTFEELYFGRVKVNGNVDLRNNVFNKGLNFYSTHVTGELLLDGSQILGTEPLDGTSYPTEFWTTTVDGVASFYNVYFAGEAYFAQSNFYRLETRDAIFDQNVSFAGTSVDRSAEFNNATFKAQADFKDFYVGNTANFSDATFQGDAIFENATSMRDVNFSNVNFNGLANFRYFTTGRFCDFINTTFEKDFWFYYTSVAWPYFDHVTFNGPVTFEGMQTSEDFELSSSYYNYTEEPFPVRLATVEGAVKFIDLVAPAGFQLSRSHFGSLNIVMTEKAEIAFIDISATEIEDEITIENVSTNSFIAEGTTVGESTNLSNVSITERLDMRNARIGFLKIDDQPQWPTDANAFNLRGMTYTDIDVGDQGLNEETLQALVGLVNQSAYSPQAYAALSQFLTDKGHPDWAAEVELAQKRRERDDVLTRFSGAWFWSWFLDIFAGYGQRPIFAFFWSGLVVAIGAFVFRRQENMLPVEQEDAQVEYNPVWYSFALFIPYVDLGIASKWEPDPRRKWARNYKYIHMMLGWILAPIAVLAFSGIIG